MTFSGKKSTTSGWVAPRFNSSQNPSANLPAVAENPSKPLIPACAEAETRLNNWLNQSEPGPNMLPSALTNSTQTDKLPSRSAGNSAGPDITGITVSDAHIASTSLKAVGYGAGGTCHDDFLELWDSHYKNQISIPTAGTDASNSPVDPGDATGYSSEDLVILRGAPYFAHITRSVGIVKLYGFNKDLSAYPVCEVVRVSSDKEYVKTSVDGVLCDAVLKGQVDDGGLHDIEPVELTEEAVKGATGDDDFDRPVTMIAKGLADPENDGKLHAVGMVNHHDDSGAGCGHEYNSEWPIILDSDGLPTKDPVNKIAFEHAGDDNSSRLFRFHGATYFETKSQEDADGTPTHEVWKLTADGATKMCSFNPMKYVARHVPGQ